MKTLRKIAKKIIPIGIGLILMGATVFGASLSDYPEPFVKDANFDARIVIGEAAATTDVIGAIDIANSLQYSMIQEKPATAGKFEGDTKIIGSELNEKLSDVTSIITDLNVLKSGEFRNRYGDTDYTQTIKVADASAVFAIDTDAEGELENIPAEYLMFPAEQTAYEYTLSFSPSLKTEHDDGDLRGLENKELTILGKTYTITRTNHEDVEIELTLMGGTQRDLLEEGTTKTYTLNEVDYEITASTITTSEVQFVINTELTSTLEEGDIFRLDDGTEIGVIDIMENEAGEAAGGDKVEFSLGAEKVRITDENTGNSDFDGTIEIGNEELDNVKVDISTSADEGTNDGDNVKISSIKIKYAPSENLYVPADGSLSEVADRVEDTEGNVFGNFDVSFKGFNEAETAEISLKPNGEEKYRLKFTNMNDQEYNVDMLYLSGDEVLLGERDSEPLNLNETAAMIKGTYFILSKNDYSHIMQIKTIKDDNVKIKDVASDGSTYELTFNGDSTADLNLDGSTYEVTLGDGDITVDMNGNGDYDDLMDTLITKYEGSLVLSGDAAERTIEFTPEDGANSDVNIAVESEELVITGLTTSWDFGGTSGLQLEDSDTYLFQNAYGEKAEWDKDEQGKFTWTYPEEQIEAKTIYYSGPITETEGTAAVTGTVKIDVGVAVLDTDPSIAGKEAAQNLIVVGGPAINRAAAALLNVPYPSYGAESTIPENKAIIKLVESGENVAMVVAGWTASDTLRASKVVAENEGLTGTEVIV